MGLFLTNVDLDSISSRTRVKSAHLQHTDIPQRVRALTEDFGPIQGSRTQICRFQLFSIGRPKSSVRARTSRWEVGMWQAGTFLLEFD